MMATNINGTVYMIIQQLGSQSIMY